MIDHLAAIDVATVAILDVDKVIHRVNDRCRYPTALGRVQVLILALVQLLILLRHIAELLVVHLRGQPPAVAL